MTFPKARLAVSACLLVAWLCYLGFLVYETRDVIVLSKPQLIIAQAYVLVEMQKGGRAEYPSEEVRVEKVLWSADGADEKLAGQVLHLAELAECGPEQGYRGAGKYLLPLNRWLTGYRIAPLPHSEMRVYPWTSETEAQLKPFIEAKK